MHGLDSYATFKIILKIKTLSGGVAQVLMHLPGKRKALNSNPSTTKNKNKNNVYTCE
jgi:peptidoglycan biosynthesis protein MviN/MurJ (putative lipid II flippase)